MDAHLYQTEVRPHTKVDTVETVREAAFFFVERFFFLLQERFFFVCGGICFGLFVFVALGGKGGEKKGEKKKRKEKKSHPPRMSLMPFLAKKWHQSRDCAPCTVKFGLRLALAKRARSSQNITDDRS